MTSLYHLSVPAKKTWRSGVPGAVFTLVMWILGSYFVRWALGFSAGGTSIYGPLAAPIAVLLWLYVLSISVLIGAAINAAIDVERHPRDGTEATGRRGLSYCGPSTGSPGGDAGPDSFSSTKITWVGVEPTFSPMCVCAGSQFASPDVRETSRDWSPTVSFRSKSLSVAITLSGWLCGVVRSPGTSRYSSTRTRSFSKTTL